jgi:hypothetical protein
MAPAVFVTAALVVGAASLYGRTAWLRSGAYCVLVAALAALWWSSLGTPRPVLLGAPRGTVAAFSLDEPRAIYVWLLLPGAHVPIALALPWRETDAAALDRAARDARQAGTRVRMGGRRDRGAGAAGSPMFYPAPAAALPPKTKP